MFTSIFYGIRRGARGYRRRAAGGAMVSNLVGGDAAMIELEQLVAGYDGVAITPPLSGMICPGSLTAIVGLNGCGKSTLLKTLAGFLPPVSGRLRWQGKTAGDRLAGAAPCPRVAVSSQRAGCGKPGRMARRVAAARSGGRHPATHRRGAGAGRAGGPWRKRRSKRSPAASFSACYLPG
ncbi:putative ABC transport system ATP-binding component [Klebsiella pneumoniae subsp. ozaenae]|uniref:Putative ABC transport system ATP-binding component n=1 Tax=Klebsiella pneumoniae subsp. ozaenae TaxID=574 RepID=A0A378AET3_KLEPO|nr:putative ABC transport system ATP-binding component [Klebsiella pneumoniae subsp. ozaenae]